MTRFEFSGTPSQLRAMYEHGYGISEIMELSGLPYGEVLPRLTAAGTSLITGGPHDISRCHHPHYLAEDHATGRCVHPAGSKRRARVA